jgi:UDPglucose 6-dehydrogenase
MDISVIGAGYVGLVTAACFAKLGNNVVCVDIDKKKIQSLKKGIPNEERPAQEAVDVYHQSQISRP